MRPARDGSVPAPASSVDGWNRVLDLSEDPAAVRVYCLLRDTWWPHPAHGTIRIELKDDLVTFTCCCGDELGVPVFLVDDFGLTP